MDSLSFIPDGCNNIEVLLVRKHCSEQEHLNTNIPEAEFNSIIEAIHHFKYKNFHKSFKTYCVGTLSLENTNHEDIKVFSKTTLKVDLEPSALKDANGRFAVLYNKKEKKPFHAFPSTTKLHSVFYTNRLIFRVSNRLFINFDVQFHPEDETIVRRIFINYNHDNNVDFDNFYMILTPIIRAISYATS